MTGPSARRRVRCVLLTLALALAALAGCTSGPDPALPNGTGGDGEAPPGQDPSNGDDRALPTARVPTANGARLMDLVHQQVYNGTDQAPRYRTPGSPGHVATVGVLASMLEDANLTVERERFQADLAELGEVNLTNVHGVRQGKDPDAGEIWLAAHWDSRAWADAEGPACEGPPVLGANDGAAAVATVVHAAEQLDRLSQTLRVALFDAEDQGGCGGDAPYQGWVQGSNHAAKQRDAAGTLDEITALILVDMPGASTLTIPPEGYSHQEAPALTDLTFEMAAELEASAFDPRCCGSNILDDHKPFLDRGVPAVDLIHLDTNGTSFFPWMWHTTEDTPEHLSEDSMEQVTRVVMGTALAIDEGHYAGEDT